MPLSRREFLQVSTGAFIGLMSMPENLFADSGKIPVLLYHDVSNEFDDDYTLSPPLFAAQMEWLYAQGYRTLFFREIEGSYKRAEDKAVILTFDDGYASFGSYVFPLLREYGFKATINPIGKYVGGYLELGANRPLLSWDEYRYFMKSGLVELGCHTYNLHIYKAGLGILGSSPKEIEDDFRLFQDTARKETGQSTQILAWPYGIFDIQAMNIARKAGFQYILTSREGYLQKGGNLLRIPRWNINNSHHFDSFRQHARGEK